MQSAQGEQKKGGGMGGMKDFGLTNKLGPERKAHSHSKVKHGGGGETKRVGVGAHGHKGPQNQL